MEQIKWIISLVPQEERLRCVIGIGIIVLLFTITALIQWRRVRRLRSQCKEEPEIHRRLTWLHWPYPIAFVTLLFLFGLAMDAVWPLMAVMIIIGFTFGCFLEVVLTEPPIVVPTAGENRGRCLIEKGRNKERVSPAFRVSADAAADARDGLKKPDQGYGKNNIS